MNKQQCPLEGLTFPVKDKQANIYCLVRQAWGPRQAQLPHTTAKALICCSLLCPGLHSFSPCSVTLSGITCCTLYGGPLYSVFVTECPWWSWEAKGIVPPSQAL